MDNSIPYSPSRLDASIFFKKNLKHLTISHQNILDIGCGQLYFYRLLVENGTQGTYLGIDLSPLKLDIPMKELNGKIQKVDFLKFKSKRKFNLVACLLKISNMLKMDGRLLLAVPSIWAWPVEFGRHGYHYYYKRNILNLVEKSGFKVVKFYESGGFLGFIFIIFYNWPRFFILAFASPIYIFFRSFGWIKQPWNQFSRNIVRKTLYLYHQSEIGIAIHNQLVKIIVNIDNIFKIFPASYILILKNEKKS